MVLSFYFQITNTLQKRGPPFLRAVGQFGAVAVLFELLWLTFILSHPAYMGSDTIQIWFQGERIRESIALYHAMPGYGPDVMAGPVDYPLVSNSPYLPPLGAVASLLPPISMENFARVSHVFLLIFLWVNSALLGRLVSGKWNLGAAFTAHGLLLLCPGTLLMMASGNIEPLLWCLFGLAFLHPQMRGAALIMMAAVKVHAIWPLLFLLGRYPRQTIRSALPAVMALVAVTVIAMGAKDTLHAGLDWLEFIPPALGQGTFYSRNVSLSFLVVRMTRWGGWEYPGGPLPDLLRAWLLFASVLGPLLVGWIFRRRAPEVQMGAVMAAALLSSPLCWMGYLPALYGPFAWVVGNHGRPENKSHLEPMACSTE